MDFSGSNIHEKDIADSNIQRTGEKFRYWQFAEIHQKASDTIENEYAAQYALDYRIGSGAFPLGNEVQDAQVGGDNQHLHGKRVIPEILKRHPEWFHGFHLRVLFYHAQCHVRSASWCVPFL